MTINRIIKELREVPLNRLEDLYSLVHSLKADSSKAAVSRKRILSFAGSFGDMNQSDYNDFLEQTRKIRGDLFDRDIDL